MRVSMGIRFPLLALAFAFVVTAIASAASENSALVSGVVKCDGCTQKHLIYEGALVGIECRNTKGEVYKHGVASIDKNGAFKVNIPPVESVQECHARLLNRYSKSPCSSSSSNGDGDTSSKLVLKNNDVGDKGGTITFVISTELKLSPISCPAAFSLLFFKKPLPPFPPKFPPKPLKKPLPPLPKFAPTFPPKPLKKPFAPLPKFPPKPKLKFPPKPLIKPLPPLPKFAPTFPPTLLKKPFAPLPKFPPKPKLKFPPKPLIKPLPPLPKFPPKPKFSFPPKPLKPFPPKPLVSPYDFYTSKATAPPTITAPTTTPPQAVAPPRSPRPPGFPRFPPTP